MKGQTAFDAVFAYVCREAVAAPRPLFFFRVRDPDKLDCAITIRCLPRQSHVSVSTVQPDPMLVWWFVRNSRHPEGLRPDTTEEGPTAQLDGSGRGAASGQLGRLSGNTQARGSRKPSRAGASDLRRLLPPGGPSARMKGQTAPRPSRAALSVAQLRDSLGDNQGMRLSERHTLPATACNFADRL